MPRYETTSPAPREVWTSILASDPDAMPSQSPEWLDAVCRRSVWRDASRLYECENGRRVLLPMLVAGVRPGGLHVTVSPRHGWGYGGIIAEGGVTQSDVELVSHDLNQTHPVRLWLRPNPLHAHWYEQCLPHLRRVARISHVVDLDGGADGVRARFHRSVGRNLSRAEKCNVQVETAPGRALLDTYFELFEKARVDWARAQSEPAWLAHARGRLRESRQKWERIAQQLGDRLRITVAWHDGAPAAAGVVLTGPNAHFTRAAMDPEIRSVGASHLVCWAVLRDATASGARWCFLGQAATKGAADFNTSFGAQAFPSVELSAERLPISRTNEVVRGVVKKAVRFDDGQKAGFPTD